ncbi:MAG: TerC family protein [Immundisolibacter sp.]|uniref:TerC family protein n=1 Tax=Immundisolibacter sp. TaxID=1934948 RepID=UPI0019C2D316|nr:TerC family protein [Immundisolibacter sp.]MBC7161664.1 TerC family protein [Immundisolibacter sp.]
MHDLPSGAAFWIALLQIIGIDIVLSGDNAVVIALASRGLPPAQRRRAVLLGTGAAIAMRVVLALVAAALMSYPGLKLAGGALLLWIGISLLRPQGGEGGHDGPTSTTLAGAVRTILVADVAMSLDNVVGIAAAAKGSAVLLILGLAISIPLIVFSSAVLLRLMDRFPVIIVIGAALLGYVAAEMMVTDSLIRDWLTATVPYVHRVAPVLGALLVVIVGKWLAARLPAPAHEVPLAEPAGEPVATHKEREQ